MVFNENLNSIIFAHRHPHMKRPFERFCEKNESEHFVESLQNNVKNSKAKTFHNAQPISTEFLKFLLFRNEKITRILNFLTTGVTLHNALKMRTASRELQKNYYAKTSLQLSLESGSISAADKCDRNISFVANMWSNGNINGTFGGTPESRDDFGKFSAADNLEAPPAGNCQKLFENIFEPSVFRTDSTVVLIRAVSENDVFVDAMSECEETETGYFVLAPKSWCLGDRVQFWISKLFLKIAEINSSWEISENHWSAESISRFLNHYFIDPNGFMTGALLTQQSGDLSFCVKVPEIIYRYVYDYACVVGPAFVKNKLRPEKIWILNETARNYFGLLLKTKNTFKILKIRKCDAKAHHVVGNVDFQPDFKRNLNYMHCVISELSEYSVQRSCCCEELDVEFMKNIRFSEHKQLLFI